MFFSIIYVLLNCSSIFCFSTRVHMWTSTINCGLHRIFNTKFWHRRSQPTCPFTRWAQRHCLCIPIKTSFLCWAAVWINTASEKSQPCCKNIPWRHGFWCTLKERTTIQHTNRVSKTRRIPLELSVNSTRFCKFLHHADSICTSRVHANMCR